MLVRTVKLTKDRLRTSPTIPTSTLVHAYTSFSRNCCLDLYKTFDNYTRIKIDFTKILFEGEWLEVI